MALLVLYHRASLLAFAGALFFLQTATPFPQASSIQENTATQEVPHPVKRPTPKPLPLPTNLILLDPAHGGEDTGAHLTSSTTEKDWTLAFTERLQPMLAAHGFNVIIARDQPTEDPAQAPDTPTENQRAEQANRLHPLACLLLHATNGGHGVHLFTSALTPSTLADPHAILPWNAAQAASITDSLRLATDLSTALNGSRIPLVLGRISVPPIDSLTCPAVAIELASLTGAAAGLDDLAYQRRVADSIVNAMVFWRGHTETEAAAREAAQPTSTSTAKLPDVPVKKSRPKPNPVDPDNPDATPVTPHKPAPIIRRPPEQPTTPDPTGAPR